MSGSQTYDEWTETEFAEYHRHSEHEALSACVVVLLILLFCSVLFFFLLVLLTMYMCGTGVRHGVLAALPREPPFWLPTLRLTMLRTSRRAHQYPPLDLPPTALVRPLRTQRMLARSTMAANCAMSSTPHLRSKLIGETVIPV